MRRLGLSAPAPHSSAIRAMKKSIPGTDLEFEVPQDWWLFCDMNIWNVNDYKYYLHNGSLKETKIANITHIEPPTRDNVIPPLKKYKFVPILLAFTSPECALPPVEVRAYNSGPYKYSITNGYHRYYASLAVGYTMLPIVVTGANEFKALTSRS